MKRKLFYAAMVLLISASTVFSQKRTIYGVVINANDGSPVSGAVVSAKGGQAKGTTNARGYYFIDLQPVDSILVFTCHGYESREIRTGNRLLIDVSLTPDKAVYDTEILAPDYEYRMNMPHRMHETMAIGISPAESGYRIHTMPHDFNTESYSAVRETGFRSTLNHPLSTFSIDVDNASYSNIRRFINGGHLPPRDAVRIEEMLNYFVYNYPEPQGKDPFAIHTELSQTPWNPNTQLLHVALKGREIEKSELPPSNLVFLIDISGSMSPANRLPLVKTAMNMLVEELRPRDRVSIVVYAGRTELILESTPASNKGKILAAINSLQAGGYTAGGQALRLAYEVAEKNFIEGGNNRIIMATDGDFNVGESSNAAMERLVEEKRRTGVFITVLGFGMGNLKDDRLEIIANKGNGNYAYIDNIREARKVLVSEFAGTLFTIAKDVKLQIEFNPARVKGYRLIGYENRRLNDEDFNNDEKDAGEMGAGHTVTALYEIIPAGSDFDIPGVDPLRYQNNPSPVRSNQNAELMTIKARYKNPDSDESILMEKAMRGRLLALGATSDDFRFASAVAEFGLLLSQSEFKGNSDFSGIIQRALASKGTDKEGYRAEFINLVRTAENLSNLAASDR